MVRLIRLFFLSVVVTVFVVLLASNRHMIMLSIDPFDLDQSEFTYAAPAYLVVFVAFVVGVLFGWLVGWRSQARARRMERENRYECAKWRTRAEMYQKECEQRGQQIEQLSKNAATQLPPSAPGNVPLLR